MVRRIVSALLILNLCVLAFSQNSFIQKLDMQQGLSNNYIVGITQDKQGCLWIATELGLNRFDGTIFNVYTKYQSVLSGNELNKVIAFKNFPIIWFATELD